MTRILVVVFALASFVALADPLAPDELAGTWNVTSTDTGGNCPNSSAGKVYSYQWIVSTEPTGIVSVSVQGETAMPKLVGNKGPKLTLDGIGALQNPKGWYDPKFAERATFILDVKGKEMSGLRRYMTIVDTKDVASGKAVRVPCYIDFDVKAKKQ